MGREETRNTEVRGTQRSTSNSEQSSLDTINTIKTMNNINSDLDKENNKENEELALSAYEKLSRDLSSDQKFLKEITLGKRIGFYRIRGELGSGNFSQVKLGIHALTKGKTLIFVNTRSTRRDQVKGENFAMLIVCVHRRCIIP